MTASSKVTGLLPAGVSCREVNDENDIVFIAKAPILSSGSLHSVDQGLRIFGGAEINECRLFLPGRKVLLKFAIAGFGSASVPTLLTWESTEGNCEM